MTGTIPGTASGLGKLRRFRTFRLLMKISVLKETAEGERRVALTPDVVSRLIKRSSAEVTVQAAAGTSAGFPDAEYLSAGAQVVEDLTLLWEADAVLGVVKPSQVPTSNALLLGLLSPLEDPQGMAHLANTGVTAFSFELVPRTAKAQSMDALSSQATVAGYEAALLAASSLGKFFPMLTTAAGTVAPARVLVLGAGVAGLQAIATSRRLGAIVSGYDVRAAAAEQVESLGAMFIELDVEQQDSTASGGYAKELTEDAQARLAEQLGEHVSRSDAVITTAAIPGRAAPRLITTQMVEAMHAGSVIVDLAAATGGNCELTRPDEVVEHNGVFVHGPTKLVSNLAAHASQMYARNVTALLDHLFPEGSLNLDFTDEIIAGSCVTHGGRIFNPRVAALIEGSS